MKENYSKSNFAYLVLKNKPRTFFAELTSISINTIKGILDKGKTPSIETLIKLNETFNISLDKLVFENLSEEK